MKRSKLQLITPFAAIALFAVVLQLTLHQPLNAQGTATANNEATVEKVETSLIEMYKTGGWAMYPLTLLSIGMFGLIVYNSTAIQADQILQPQLMPKIDEALEALDIAKAKTLCESNPGPLTNIIKAGLSRTDISNYNSEQIKEAMEEASAEELSDPYLLINYLSIIAALSPMVGLLGTVSGMVKAFNVIKTEGAGSAQALAGNISEALITTATGMIIGIPAMFFFFFFKNKYGKITSRIARILGDLQFTIKTKINSRS
ncbi:MAG: biopolymer transport protein ExbB [Lentimonas sp.]|jgi:biopolymer transport protein ExbB